MQNLWQIDTVLLLGGGGSDLRWLHVRVDGYRSSVANSLAPLSWHITPIISCSRRLPGEETLLGSNRDPHLSWDVAYIQHPRQSGPPGSHSEP